MAAKLYPLFLLGPLLLLCLRSRRMADYFTLLSTFVVGERVYDHIQAMSAARSRRSCRRAMPR